MYLIEASIAITRSLSIDAYRKERKQIACDELKQYAQHNTINKEFHNDDRKHRNKTIGKCDGNNIDTSWMLFYHANDSIKHKHAHVHTQTIHIRNESIIQKIG